MRKERWSSPGGSGSPVPEESGLFDSRIPGPGDIRRIGPRAPNRQDQADHTIRTLARSPGAIEGFAFLQRRSVRNSMDPLTHFTAGALAGRALAARFGAWRMFLFCVAACWMPDVDSLLPLGAEGYLLYHRGFTHSLFGLPVLSAVLAGAFRVAWKDASFTRLFCLGLGVMTLQVYLDLATTFGTMVLWPVTDRRFAFPGVFIVDPLLTLALLALLGASLLKRAQRAHLGTVGVALVLLYPLASWGIGAASKARLENALRKRIPALERVEVTTDILTPLYWKVVADDGERLLTAGLGPLPSLELTELEPFPKADPDLLRRLGSTASIFRTWLWFAKYPVVSREVPMNGGWRITFTDLRFSTRSPAGRRLLASYEPPFTLTAVLNANGELIGWSYGRRGERLVPAIPD
jgi:inner membrane protein